MNGKTKEQIAREEVAKIQSNLCRAMHGGEMERILNSRLKDAVFALNQILKEEEQKRDSAVYKWLEN